MQRKLFVLFAGLVLFSLLIAPVGMANAQVEVQVSIPNCPPFDPALMHDKGFLQSLPPECAKAYQKLTQEGGNQAVKPDITPLAVGGPDDFGYTWDDSVTLSWIDATGGTDTGLSGDGWNNATGPITLPFSFKYYENTYSQAYITASGYLGFTDYGYWPWQQNPMPSIDQPNNVIAPFWTVTNLANSGPAGRVYYISGGTAPNRFFVVEWYDIQGGTSLDSSGGDETYRFEVVLHENGDILFQYHTMIYNDWRYYASIGIEDIDGNGLGYMDWGNYWSRLPSSNKAVRFYRPAPSARVKLTPTQQGKFTQAGAAQSFQMDVRNTGDLGADTYDLATASAWPVTLYAADGVTPLTDTDSDSAIDTGSLAQGSTVTITAKVATPGGAVVGNANSAIITARSSVNTSKSKTATLQSAVPAPFAQVYDDYADGAMSLNLIQPSAQVMKKATADGYYGSSMAVALAPNGNFVYLWTKYHWTGSVSVREIEYTLLDHYGNTVRAVSKLTDNSGASMNTYDSSPSVAVAPNGTIGVAWYRYLYNSSTYQSNYNIYFAALNASGNLTSGPTNLTNNAIWGTWDDPNIPRFYSPTIAASDDNRFILSWEKYIDYPSSYTDNIWYATYDTSGASVFAPAALTSDDMSWSPILNSLTGGKVILTWNSYDDPTYAVLNSSGGVTKPAANFGVFNVWETPDAVLLPNGKVAVAWATDTGVQFAILNSSYALETLSTEASNPSLAYGYGLSVTTDSSSRVIMTWVDGDTGQNLFYALGDSAGAFITPPMFYKQSSDYIATSYNGQGNVSYSLPAGVDGVASLSAALVGGQPGGNALVGIQTTNHGAAIATGVTLTVTLDSNLTYVSDTSGVVPSVSGNTVTWNLPDMAPLDGQNFTLSVGVPSGAALGTLYPLSLSLTSNETDLNPGDNTDNAQVMAALQVYLPLIMR